MKGFTMIELIFVIVILGVLAAVAIPRLIATRDDAEVVRTAHNVATSLNDLVGYYTAQGEYNQDFSQMMNVPNPIRVKGHICAAYTYDNKEQVTLTKGRDGLCDRVWSMPGLKNIDNIYSSNALIIVQ